MNLETAAAQFFSKAKPSKWMLDNVKRVHMKYYSFSKNNGCIRQLIPLMMSKQGQQMFGTKCTLEISSKPCKPVVYVEWSSGEKMTWDVTDLSLKDFRYWFKQKTKHVEMIDLLTDSSAIGDTSDGYVENVKIPNAPDTAYQYIEKKYGTSDPEVLFKKYDAGEIKPPTKLEVWRDAGMVPVYLDGYLTGVSEPGGKIPEGSKPGPAAKYFEGIIQTGGAAKPPPGGPGAPGAPGKAPSKPAAKK